MVMAMVMVMDGVGNGDGNMGMVMDGVGNGDGNMGMVLAKFKVIIMVMAMVMAIW